MYLAVSIQILHGDNICLELLVTDKTYYDFVGCHTNKIGAYVAVGCSYTSHSHPFQSLQWRHNEHYGVSNYQLYDCLLNRIFRRRSKKTSKRRLIGLCEGNSPVTGDSPHKGPVTRKMFPFDDVISHGKMDQLDLCLCWFWPFDLFITIKALIHIYKIIIEVNLGILKRNWILSDGIEKHSLLHVYVTNDVFLKRHYWPGLLIWIKTVHPRQYTNY